MRALRAQEAVGAPGKTRTSNPQIRSLVLYPIELRALNQGRDTSQTGMGWQGFESAGVAACAHRLTSGHKPLIPAWNSHALPVVSKQF